MDNELKHYGVPGMRWGHRKTTAKGNTLKSEKNISKSKKIVKGILAGIGGLAVGAVAYKGLQLAITIENMKAIY